MMSAPARRIDVSVSSMIRVSSTQPRSAAALISEYTSHGHCGILDGEEIVKIVDFGIAQLKPTNEEAQAQSTKHRKLTKTGMIVGTPEYMSPEFSGVFW